MNYHWTSCPSCGCQVSINLTEYGDRGSGSLRRWSTDRTVNDGKPLEIPAAGRGPDGSFEVTCVCGQRLRVEGKPSAVGEERDGDLRVNLGE